jgi:hypothetical protein
MARKLSPSADIEQRAGADDDSTNRLPTPTPQPSPGLLIVDPRRTLTPDEQAIADFLTSQRCGVFGQCEPTDQPGVSTGDFLVWYCWGGSGGVVTEGKTKSEIEDTSSEGLSAAISSEIQVAGSGELHHRRHSTTAGHDTRRGGAIHESRLRIR